MKNTDLISILMPVKNTECFLTDCISSILDQTDKNWELIAIDDHSTDDSAQIIRKFSNQDSRISLVTNNGNGIIQALRTALNESRGTFITRMDSDDIMAPEKLASLKHILLKNGPGHISTGMVKYFSNTILGNGYINYQNWLNNLSSNESNWDEIYKECVLPSPCWMTYKSDLIKCDAFDSNIYPEDYDLCFRFFKNNLKIKSCNQILHFWRDHSSRTSRNNPVYRHQTYFDLKLKYFFDFWTKENQLVLWGAGKKGKLLAKKIKQDGPSFLWVCNNQKKHGKYIHDIKIDDYSKIISIKTPKIIVSVSSPKDIIEIKTFLNKNSLINNYHYFFFC